MVAMQSPNVPSLSKTNMRDSDEKSKSDIESAENTHSSSINMVLRMDGLISLEGEEEEGNARRDNTDATAGVDNTVDDDRYDE